jgi:hypothetical protein
MITILPILDHFYLTIDFLAVFRGLFFGSCISSLRFLCTRTLQTLNLVAPPRPSAPALDPAYVLAALSLILRNPALLSRRASSSEAVGVTFGPLGCLTVSIRVFKDSSRPKHYFGNSQSLGVRSRSGNSLDSDVDHLHPG